MYSQKKNLVVFLLFFLIVFSAYSDNYDASWHFDDYPNIVDNPRIHIKDFRLDILKGTFFAAFDKGEYLGRRVYRPVSMFTFALNWYIGKEFLTQSENDEFCLKSKDLPIQVGATK